jgi:hypothetical protein
MTKIPKSDMLRDANRLYYHVSPLPKFTGNRQDSISEVNLILDELQTRQSESDLPIPEYRALVKLIARYERLLQALESGGRAFGNNAGIGSTSFYATSQPEFWQSVQEDELGVDYSRGGIYAIILKRPRTERMVPAGMGTLAPEVSVSLSNVQTILGPFKTTTQADTAINHHQSTRDRTVSITPGHNSPGKKVITDPDERMKYATWGQLFAMIDGVEHRVPRGALEDDFDPVIQTYIKT